MRSMRLKTIVAVTALLSLASHAMALIEISDGGLHDIDYPINDTVWVYSDLPGLQTIINILDGAILEDLEAGRNSIANVYGGSIEFVWTYENAQANISGGSVVAVDALWDSRVDISGGLILEAIAAEENAIITIHGCDFAVDGTPVGYIELSTVLGPGFPHRLAGTLLSGDALDVYCIVAPDGQIFLVPEPGTILLLGLGGIGLLRRRNKP